MPHTTPFVEEFFRVLVPGILDAIVVSVLTRWENKEVWDDKNKSLTHVLVIRNPSRENVHTTGSGLRHRRRTQFHPIHGPFHCAGRLVINASAPGPSSYY